MKRDIIINYDNIAEKHNYIVELLTAEYQKIDNTGPERENIPYQLICELLDEKGYHYTLLTGNDCKGFFQCRVTLNGHHSYMPIMRECHHTEQAAALIAEGADLYAIWSALTSSDPFTLDDLSRNMTDFKNLS